MGLSSFISKRISKESGGSFSATINRVAVMSIGIGLTVLILAFMVLYGFKKEIRDKIYSLSGHLIISKYTLSTSFEETAITINEELLQEFQSYPYVEVVQPYAMKAGLLKTSEEVQGVILKGIDKRFDTAKFNKNIIKGRFPNLPETSYSTEVVLSNRISNYLELSVEDEVLIYFVQNPPRFRKLQVVGIYETGLEEFDEKIILGDLNLIRRINNWSDTLASGVEVFISDIEKLDQVENDLFDALGIDLYVNKITDRYVQIFEWLNLLNRNVIILLTIILFVAGTSIISILLILIIERTQMIGILKSLGASDKMIRMIFIFNGLRLIIKGLFWGNVIGLSLGLIQRVFMVIPLDEANYYMSHVPIEIDFLTIVCLNMLVLTLVGLTLMIPVTFISRIKVVQAIRFD